MSTIIGIVDGWEVRSRDDGSFGVYDLHGLISGPHGSTTEAIGAALKLPMMTPVLDGRSGKPRLTVGGPQT